MGIILHIPHSSKEIPKQYKRLFYEPEALGDELEAMTDMYTDQLFNQQYTKLIFPLSRLVCDVERFRDPSQESMTARGMWICYSKNSMGKQLKRLETSYVQDMLVNYYDKHHTKLTKMVTEDLKQAGKTLIVDCHSFPEQMPWLDKQAWPEVDICIGADKFHTPSKLVDTISHEFAKRGYKVAINAPFAGTLVPMKYYQQNKAVQSVMLEINRRLYYDADTKSQNNNFVQLREHISEILEKIERHLADGGTSPIYWRTYDLVCLPVFCKNRR